MLDLICLGITCLSVFLILILPALIAFVGWVCNILDEGEHSFKYPDPDMLPWIRWIDEQPGIDVFLLAMMSLAVCAVSGILYIEGKLGFVCSIIVGLAASIYGLYWLGRYFLRRKKKIKKTFDTLKGE